MRASRCGKVPLRLIAAQLLGIWQRNVILCIILYHIHYIILFKINLATTQRFREDSGASRDVRAPNSVGATTPGNVCHQSSRP
jgi:hypothetical protein